MPFAILWIGGAVAVLAGVAFVISSRFREGVTDFTGGAGALLGGIGKGASALVDATEAGAHLIDAGAEVGGATAIEAFQIVTGTEQTGTTPEGRKVAGFVNFMEPQTADDTGLLNGAIVRGNATEDMWRRANIYVVQLQENIAIRNESGMSPIAQSRITGWPSWKQFYSDLNVNPNLLGSLTSLPIENN